ncbi:MAG: Holliday junction branch migration protein RuvA [Firmicutes bacterium]|nr:Holliday junction branch migration protein RuvA [Bacillota bacterium]
MISYIKGILKYKGADHVIVETGGIGFRINTSADTVSKLPQTESNVQLFTHMNVKEDEMSLFGFLTQEELMMFDRLITVKGVGPKGATALLAGLTPAQISLAIITDDVKTLSSGQGIGKKTAQQIILDLKDKTKTMDAAGASLAAAVPAAENTAVSEAVEALVTLGFGKPEAQKAVSAIASDDLTAAELISKALKVIG